MKLYEIFIQNNLDYSDYDCMTKLIVANGQEEADIRAESFMKEHYYMDAYRKPSFEAVEISMVDGFKIKVERSWKNDN